LKVVRTAPGFEFVAGTIEGIKVISMHERIRL
jgi:hypothetical protein